MKISDEEKAAFRTFVEEQANLLYEVNQLIRKNIDEYHKTMCDNQTELCTRSVHNIMYVAINSELSRHAEIAEGVDETIAKIFSEHKKEGT